MGWIHDMKSQGACVEFLITHYAEIFAKMYIGDGGGDSGAVDNK